MILDVQRAFDAVRPGGNTIHGRGARPHPHAERVACSAILLFEFLVNPRRLPHDLQTKRSQRLGRKSCHNLIGLRE